MRDIRPASPEEIQARINEAYVFAAKAEDTAYGRGRGVQELLGHGQSYAELPGFGGRSAKSFFESLRPGAAVLDVGCGYGQLGMEVKFFCAAGVHIYGFDAKVQPGQERLSGAVLGNIDHLSTRLFDGKRFDLVVSSALLYHLPDYWGAILRMSNLLAPQGVLLASTVPRVIKALGESVDDERGMLTQTDPGTFFYYRRHNVLTVDGTLMPTGPLVALLNAVSRDLVLEYSVVPASHISAVANVGGQISGKKISAEGALDMSLFFYCLCDGELSYVVARTEQERQQLTAQGYVGLTERG